MRHNRNWARILLCLLLLCCLPMQTFAVGLIEPERDASLDIRFQYGDTRIPNASFKLYYLAQVDKTAHFTLTERFARYPISVEHQTTEGWKELAQALKGYVLGDALASDYSGTTNQQGSLSFQNMKTGLYFVMGEKLAYDGYLYTIEPTIVSLPNLMNNQWVYDVTINPKSTREQEPIPITEVKVTKAWEDSGAEEYRPREITVNLLKDGKVYDSVKLSSSNNWKKVWKNLPELDDMRLPIDWSVSEDAVKDYKVRIQRTDNVFVVVNHYTGPMPPKKLPQTGQLWWPIPVLAFSGLCCIAIGTLISRRKRQE